MNLSAKHPRPTTWGGNSLTIRCLFDPIQDWWLMVISSRKAGQMAVETEQSLESIKLDWRTLVLFQFELNHLSFV